MAVALCDVLLPRVTGVVIDSAVSGAGRIGLYGGILSGLIFPAGFMVWLFIVRAGVTGTGVATIFAGCIRRVFNSFRFRSMTIVPVVGSWRG